MTDFHVGTSSGPRGWVIIDAAEGNPLAGGVDLDSLREALLRWMGWSEADRAARAAVGAPRHSRESLTDRIALVEIRPGDVEATHERVDAMLASTLRSHLWWEGADGPTRGETLDRIADLTATWGVTFSTTPQAILGAIESDRTRRRESDRLRRLTRPTVYRDER